MRKHPVGRRKIQRVWCLGSQVKGESFEAESCPGITAAQRPGKISRERPLALASQGPLVTNASSFGGVVGMV